MTTIDVLNDDEETLRHCRAAVTASGGAAPAPGGHVDPVPIGDPDEDGDRGDDDDEDDEGDEDEGEEEEPLHCGSPALILSPA